MFADRRILDLFGIELPILQAPMAGASGTDLAIAVSEAGGLGALPSAFLGPDELRNQIGIVRQRTARPLNLNFFCHAPPLRDAAKEAAWLARFAPFYDEAGVTPPDSLASPAKAFDAAAAEVVAEARPAVVSFHFGLPEDWLLDRVRESGARVIASATTVAEARILDARGCDAVIAQGAEAGGHRGMFTPDGVESQVGLFALLPQVVDAVRVPVIAAGGIGDARGIAAAFVLGASAVQMGTAYIRCPESIISPLHRAALATATDDATAITNVFSGRPARGIVNRVMRALGPISDDVAAFPLAGGAYGPLRAAAEKAGSSDFSSLWSGQAVALTKERPAAELTRSLAEEAAAILSGWGRPT